MYIDIGYLFIFFLVISILNKCYTSFQLLCKYNWDIHDINLNTFIVEKIVSKLINSSVFI
jgi:hypothetical protein